MVATPIVNDTHSLAINDPRDAVRNVGGLIYPIVVVMQGWFHNKVARSFLLFDFIFHFLVWLSTHLIQNRHS
jgi:hypothetical protein